MPRMTIEQRYEFLKHVNSVIFDYIRFPFAKVKPGTQKFTQLVDMFQDRVKQLRIGSEWMPWVVGESANCRTFKAAEVGAHILIGIDVTLSLENGRHQRFRILEQNPYKRDKSGNFKETSVLAQKGNRLAWVIDITDPDRNKHEFLGKLLNGEFIPNKPRATTKFTPGPNGYGTVSRDVREDQHGTPFEEVNGDWVNRLPDVDPNNFDVVGIV